MSRVSTASPCNKHGIQWDLPLQTPLDSSHLNQVDMLLLRSQLYFSIHWHPPKSGHLTIPYSGQSFYIPRLHELHLKMGTVGCTRTYLRY